MQKLIAVPIAAVLFLAQPALHALAHVKAGKLRALAVYLKEQLGIWKTALKTAGVEPQ